MKHTCLVCGGDMKHIKDRDWVCTECGADAWMGDYGCLCFDADLFDDEDDSEAISVYDAALIWASNGKDEDYTYGYSEDELEEALK